MSMNNYSKIKAFISKYFPKFAIRPVVKYIMPIVRPLEKRFTKKIEYSKDYYETDYHGKRFNLKQKSFNEIMAEWEKEGFKTELYDVIEKLDIENSNDTQWLEVGCMHGKTVWWVNELYSKIKYHLFDFSEVAIDWCNEMNPIPDQTKIWVGDIIDIQYNENRLDDFFDYITCIDVTEHLPKDIYLKGISEMFRVLKYGGILILKQGISVSPEHINVLSEEKLVSDFQDAGFDYMKKLPERYHIFTKNEDK